nr:MAG TPA: hypothetical protein [Caudoviricetes sp.]
MEAASISWIRMWCGSSRPGSQPDLGLCVHLIILLPES